jgi:uncharacterized protein YqhQ
MSENLPTYGGQAVIEGVMMRGTQGVAIAMRAPNQQIVIHTEQLQAIYRSRYTKLPFIRGLLALWDALGLGMRALTISANTQTGEDEKLEGPQLFFTLAFAIGLVLTLFFITPASVGHMVEENLNVSPWVSNLLEGVLRLVMLIGYVLLISLMPDIKRVFAYHGAEHKTINAYEAGVELTPENVATFSLEHPRCGTAFLLTLMLLSILVFSLLGPMPGALRILSRIIFIPLLASLAYEYIRWTAKNLHSPLVRWMIKPNLALQRLTTREPSLEMIEVAIAAFNAMRTEERVVRL